MCSKISATNKHAWFELRTPQIDKACRGYEISHPYIPISTNFTWISMNISITTYPVHGTRSHRISQSTTGARAPIPQRPGRRQFPLLKSLKNRRTWKLNTQLHWNMCLVKYFSNFPENLHNFSAPVLSWTHVAFTSMWSGVDAFEAHFVPALKFLENQKKRL